jgi:hypothetical protein
LEVAADVRPPRFYLPGGDHRADPPPADVLYVPIAAFVLLKRVGFPGDVVKVSELSERSENMGTTRIE